MKIFLSLVFFYNFLFSSYEQVKIGKIDKYYEDKITEQEIISLIKDIENLFETQLGKNIFDYSSNGKPIDILYVSNSKLEDAFRRKTEKLTAKKEKILEIQNSFPTKKDEINKLQESLNSQTKLLNTMIETLNKYVRDVNSRKNITREELNSAKTYVENEKLKINQESRIQKDIKNSLNRILTEYNQKVFIYNNLVRESNSLIKEMESIGRSVKIVNGRTFGMKETTLKTSYIDGKEIQEKSIKNSMNRIEIYSFDSKEHLKVILAHEIAHLVGIPHIEVNGALMNPILQENQKEKLSLTFEDLKNFRENF